MDVKLIERASARLGDVIVDPALWPEILQEISRGAKARGAVLLQGDARTADVPRTAGVDAYVDSYFAEGWHTRDIRAQRSVPLLLSGASVIIDQDIVTPEEMDRVGLYAESLIPNGLRWFAAVGFRSGPAVWGLSIQRADSEGPFESQDKRILAQLSERLTQIATLSHAVGQASLKGMTNALDLVNQPALALDRAGRVRDVNRSAERIFGDEIRVSNHRLVVHDQRARAALDELTDQLRTASDTIPLAAMPIVIQRRDRRPVIARVLPVDGAARNPFVGARALLVLSDLDRSVVPDATVMARIFRLSPAEARVAMRIVAGASLREAADELMIAHETARHQLKAVFAKTGTNRQSQLVALLARLPRLASPD